MIFMIRTSLELMALAFLVPGLWFGLAGLGISSAIARRRAVSKEPVDALRRRTRVGLDVALLLAAPLAMLAWGLFFWPDHGRSPIEAATLRGLDVLAMLQLAVCLLVAWKRRGKIWWVVAAAVAMWWAAGAHFAASMAVTNTWL